MISKILALEALIGTIRAHLSVPVRNVSDIAPEQHSHEIINAIELLSDKDKQLAEARAEIERLKNENESLMFLVKNQRCCRNCGNHASWNFDTCGFGENPKDSDEGPECRRSNLKRWRPMEYRRAKAELAAERGE